MTPGPESLIGQVFGGYRLTQLLGNDGVSAIFLGQRDSNSAAEGAPEQARIRVFILPASLSADDQRAFRERFLREAELLKGLRGPHILAVLDAGADESSGFPYLVSPFIGGDTLAARLAVAPPPLDVASRYFAQLAESLDVAHGRGIVHGDVNPGNILFDQRDQLFLADFGLTRLLGSAYAAPPSGQAALVGTRLYLAPEQLLGEQYGAPADSYSAGLVLYQMVTGRFPYQAQSPIDLLFQMTHGAPFPPRMFRPDLPPPAEAAILRALARDPAWRLGSVGRVNQAFTLGLYGQWSDDLRLPPGTPQPAVQQGTPALGYPAPYPQPYPQPYLEQSAQGVARPPTSAGRRPALIAATAVVLVVLLLASIGVYLRAQQPSGAHGIGGGVATNTAGSSSGPTMAAGARELEIATDLPVSGTDAAVGLPTQYGVDLAVQQNADLGNGYTLTVVHKNDEGTSGPDPSVGAANIQALVSDPSVMAMVGPFNSGVAKAEIPVANGSGLVLISPSNTNPGLTKQQYAAANGINYNLLHPAGRPNYYFRITAPDDVQGKVDADIALAAPVSATTAYVVDDSTTYGKMLTQAFTAEFTSKGGTVVGSDSITASQVDNLPQLAATIISKHPGVVFYGGVTSGGGGELKKDLVSQGGNMPMVGGDGIADDPAWTQTAGAAAVNTYGTVAAPDIAGLTSAAGQQFISAYQSAFPGSDLLPYSAMAYDAAMIEITAIKNLITLGKDVTRKAVRDEIQGISYTGVTSVIAFDQNGDNAGNKVYSIYEVGNDGEWRFVKIVNA